MESFETLRLRRVDRPDYQAIADLWTAAEPFRPRTEAMAREHDERRRVGGCVSRWIVAEDADGVLAGAAWVGSEVFRSIPHNPSFSLVVHPDWRRRGLASALGRMLRKAAEDLAPESFLTESWQAEADLDPIAVHLGFERVSRFVELHLHLDAADGPAEAVALRAEAGALAARGLRVVSFAEMPDTPAFWANYGALNRAVSPDLPGPDPCTVPDDDTLRREVVENARFWSQASFLAIDEATGAQVALSSLWRTPLPDTASIGLTAVQRDWRRTGLARHLKRRAAQVAREAGLAVLRTHCFEGNGAMIALNLGLGFRAERHQTWWRLKV